MSMSKGVTAPDVGVSTIHPASTFLRFSTDGLQNSSWQPMNANDQRTEWERLHCSPPSGRGDSLQHPPTPFFDPKYQYLPETDPSARCRWNKCHLLSLPADIRLQIYRYLLTDTLTPKICVRIDRQPSQPYYKFTRPPTPTLTLSLEPRPTTFPSLEILRVNRIIYEEALPVLYDSVKFVPVHLDGLLPMFLSELSPHAKSCIRRICLTMPPSAVGMETHHDRCKNFTNWAVTCAQVALMGSLQEVEIHGDLELYRHRSDRRLLLRPLCKIRVPKLFIVDGKSLEDTRNYNNLGQQMLLETKFDMDAEAEVRQQRTKAEAADRADRNRRLNIEPTGHCNPSPSRPQRRGIDRVGETPDRLEMHWWREENEVSMRHGLGSIAGIKQFEKELEWHTTPPVPSDDPPTYGLPDRRRSTEKQATLDTDSASDTDQWDLVSIRSGASTPKAGRSIKKAARPKSFSEEEWVDAASTLVGHDEDENWEHVEK
ncbi:hypothetical protein BCR34DRAFT_286887 [Clohesyomyces aquaticus]|uniref:DUF7730 domain-containing protein n=1 Tax=Clohesyomyces aquaticus TaxID=1231657 RepID=A0A1Y1ZRM9_9PLEO|nr:hypothetical protein BCR34DRAFT_286887 [Clohesyomyces aquaticus]